MSAKPRKTRSDSKLDSLEPESRVLELRDGLIAGWSHDAAKEWLWEECQVTTSGAALTHFFRRHCVPLLQERKKWAALSAEALGEMATETQAFEDAAIGELIEFAYQFIRDPKGDPEAKRKWMETLIKGQGSRREDRRVAAAIKNKIEAGLDALAEEIKGNKKAQAIYAELKKEVAK